jgi:charged multivesicular body protein 1
MKFATKQLARLSKKCEKKEAVLKNKTADAIKKGNMDVAKEYASSAIREKSQALSYLKLSSRIDAVSARVETAVRMNGLTRAMGGIVQGMDSVLQTMDINKIANTMDKFEQQFDSLDVRSGYMEDAIDSTTALSTPDEQVQALMHEVAAQNGLEVAAEMDSLGPLGTATAASTAARSRPAAAQPVAMGEAAGGAAPGAGGGSSPAGGGGAGGGGTDFMARLAALKK